MGEFVPGVSAVIIADELSQNIGRSVRLISSSAEEFVSYIDPAGHPWYVDNPQRVTCWIVEDEIDVIDEDTGEITTDQVYALPQSSLMIIGGYAPDRDELREMWLDADRRILNRITLSLDKVRHHYQ